MKFCPKCNNTFEDAVGFCPTDGEVLQASPTDIVGQVLDGKYQVESFIAQGGMGAVYKAQHILLGDKVVIKTLRSEMRGNSEWLRRFQREGRAARSFHHPNAVTVYDLSTASDGLIYMVMEYVEGHTLDKELKQRGRFMPQEALEVLEPVADVLDAAHARGVVHRDLKPENVMLGTREDGRSIIKVLDLGIAKMVGMPDAQASDATSLTVAGQILGTPYYMSPEQWGEIPRDGKQEVDGRADIYALGVIFFELVAGRKPLGGRTLSELRQEHVSAALPSLQTVAPNVPERFASAVTRAMAKDRGDRYDTAGEMVEEMRSALGLPPRLQVPIATGGNFRYDAGGASQVGGNEAATANLPHGATSPEVGSAATITGAGDLRSAGGGATSAQAPYPATSPNISNPPPASAAATRSVHPSTATGAGLHGQAHGIGETRVAPGVGQTPSETYTPAPSSKAPLIAGISLGALLLAGAGGWFVWSRMSPDEPVRNGNAGANVAANSGAANTAPANTAPPVAAKAEALSYWVEAFDDPKAESGRRVADMLASLKSGQNFKFHFRPAERGYLYIVGPGAKGNVPMTFLTAQGAGALKTNQVLKDADFVFPLGQKLVLNDIPGTEEYTVIFSPTPLSKPSFLTGKYLHELTTEEMKEFDDFLAEHRANTPSASIKDEGGQKAVSVMVPGGVSDKPIVYGLRIEHK
jgi:serine/threonine-protein kinase